MTYILVFRGELEPGVSRRQAAEVIAEKLGKPLELVEEKLFVGKPVRVATADTKERARYYVDIFREAGAKLEVRVPKVATPPAANVEAATPDAEVPAASPEPIRAPKRSAEPDAGKSSGLKIGLAVAATVLLAVIAGAAWWTMPVWMNGSTSQEQLVASNALATRDLVGLAHLDVDRGLQLQERLFGAPDPDALLSGDDSLWDSLVEAGIDPAAQIDDAIIALYADETDPDAEAGWGVVITGSLDAESVRTWLTSRYDVERFDTETATIHFGWLDEATCEPVPPKAARIGSSHVAIADADRIDAVWERLETAAPAEVPIDDWLAMTEEQLLTIGVMNPTGMGHAAGGMTGMMLAAAGQAATPAEALYFGIAPQLVPPGVVLSGSITSDDSMFLDMTNTAAMGWLTEAKEKTADKPEVLAMIERISFSLEERTFTAGIRFDTDVDEEIQRLASGLMGGVVSVSSGMPDGYVPEDQVNEDPMQFGNVAATSLRPFEDFGDSFHPPQWQGGPFALGITRVVAGDDGLQLTIRGEGRGLPNLGSRAKLVRMRIDDVTDEQGASLLPLRACGPTSAREWAESSPVTTGSRFVGTELVKFPTVSIQKSITLADGSNAGDVARIKGNIEFQMPVEIQAMRIAMPVEGQLVETKDLRVLFQGGTEHSISYQLSGDKSRLLEVRALNAAGQVLETGGASWTGGFFGGSENVSIDVQGTIASIELIIADRTETLSYSFEIDSAFPPIDEDLSVPLLPFEVADASALNSAMQLDSPEPEFDWNPPLASTAAGPAFVAVQRLQASSFMGLTTRIGVYVPDAMPLAGHLNGGAVVLETAELADGTTVPLTLRGPVGLEPQGHIFNNEFRGDPDKPWLQGEADLQMVDYDAATPVVLAGRLVFRAPVDTETVTMPATPGSRHAGDGLELVVSEWQPNNIEVDVPQGAERILFVEALDADGNPAGRASRIAGSGEDLEVRISNLMAHPETLRVVLATESAEHEVPFSVTLDQGESVAGSIDEIDTM